MNQSAHYPPIAIIGAGSWGTALAVVLGQNRREVRLWPRRREQAEVLTWERENKLYLPGIQLPDQVTIRADAQEALCDCGMVILAVPAKGMQEIIAHIAPFLSADQPLISAAKGLEPDSGKRMSEIIREAAPRQPLAVLSGPNLAGEVAAGMPTTAVVASEDTQLAKFAQQALMCPTFRVYTNRDVTGVELGGALKNIIAISAGISDGMGFGDNAKAALVTRGLAEMIRLGAAMGACPQTFQGLSGIGDLTATCASNRSRNHQVGFRLAQGEKLVDIVSHMDQIAEGVPTTRAAARLAAKYQVEMPITAQLYAILFDEVAPAAAVERLMCRSGRDELE